ncbi:hypothetical protein [Escherichia phage wV8]|uniref:Uncharacterized protein 51A n=1 Tax=Escherichia phage wV8 TaxID=576791 RepID=C5H7I1_9CAUD|nr:hypothetical protein WV8_gp053 [Escherichia phage wV8]ACJ71865.1 hypothetical protein [Escherichia phage wV8]
MPLTQLRGICYGLQLTQSGLSLDLRIGAPTRTRTLISCLQGNRNNQLYDRSINLEHPEGIEPSTSVWKTVIFPFKLWMH